MNEKVKNLMKTAVTLAIIKKMAKRTEKRVSKSLTSRPSAKAIKVGKGKIKVFKESERTHSLWK